jgi:hypothetical protein
MSVRPPIVCALLGAVVGVLLIVAPAETPAPLAIAYLNTPAVPLLYGSSSSLATLVAANAAICAFLGLLIGLAIAFRERHAHRDRRPSREL